MKYFRRYAVVVLMILGVTAVAAGIVAADESAKRISLGQTQSVVVWGSDAGVYQPASVTDAEEIFDSISALIK